MVLWRVVGPWQEKPYGLPLESVMVSGIFFLETNDITMENHHVSWENHRKIIGKWWFYITMENHNV